jgi:nucleotide-binding universal stress UspA family protein
MHKRILVPIDGSTTSLKGLREAIGMAKETGAQILLVHVVDAHTLFLAPDAGFVIADVIESLRQAGKSILAKALASTTKAGVRASTALVESLTQPAADGIVRQAKKWKADLIVMGTHGRRGLQRMLMGSDAEQVVRSAAAPVLLIRGR